MTGSSSSSSSYHAHAHNCIAMGNTQGQKALVLPPAPEKQAGGAGGRDSRRASSNLLPLAASIGLQDRRRNSSSSSGKSGGGVFSRFYSQRQQRVRDALLLQAASPASASASASSTAASPTGSSLPATPLGEWTVPSTLVGAMETLAEVEHGQLNGNAEQMDFRKSISSSASAFSSPTLFRSATSPATCFSLFFPTVITVVFLRLVDVASNSVCFFYFFF